jgi:hypothetical protein
MLETIIVILLVLWLLGIFTGIGTPYLIHLLAIVALIVLVIRFVTGRKVV